MRRAAASYRIFRPCAPLRAPGSTPPRGRTDLDRGIRLLLPTAVTPARYAAHGARDRHPRFV